MDYSTIKFYGGVEWEKFNRNPYSLIQAQDFLLTFFQTCERERKQREDAAR